jgi:aspartyl/glutamyl-tRNA(Asn/Gln) amidotransferase C subunit
LVELAGLEVEQTEMKSLTREISAIIQYFSQIKSLAEQETILWGVDPGAAVALRQDEIDTAQAIHDPRSFAPDFESGFFVVPRPESIGEE